MTEQVSQRLIEVATKTEADDISTSQRLIEVAYKPKTTNFVSQRLVEVAYIHSGRVFGAALIHV